MRWPKKKRMKMRWDFSTLKQTNPFFLTKLPPLITRDSGPKDKNSHIYSSKCLPHITIYQLSKINNKFKLNLVRDRIKDSSTIHPCWPNLRHWGMKITLWTIPSSYQTARLFLTQKYSIFSTSTKSILTRSPHKMRAKLILWWPTIMDYILEFWNR